MATSPTPIPFVHVARATVLVGSGIRRGAVLNFVGNDSAILARSITTADDIERLGLALVATAAAARATDARPVPIGASPHCEVRLMPPVAEASCGDPAIDRWMKQRTVNAPHDDLGQWSTFEELLRDYRRWADTNGEPTIGYVGTGHHRFVRALEAVRVRQAMRRRPFTEQRYRVFSLALVDQPVDESVAA